MERFDEAPSGEVGLSDLLAGHRGAPPDSVTYGYDAGSARVAVERLGHVSGYDTLCRVVFTGTAVDARGDGAERRPAPPPAGEHGYGLAVPPGGYGQAGGGAEVFGGVPGVRAPVGTGGELGRAPLSRARPLEPPGRGEAATRAPS